MQGAQAAGPVRRKARSCCSCSSAILRAWRCRCVTTGTRRCCRKPRAACNCRLLRQALRAVVQHHDSLRLRFRQDTAGVWQQIYETASDNELDELLWVRAARRCRAARRRCATRPSAAWTSATARCCGRWWSNCRAAKRVDAGDPSPGGRWRVVAHPARGPAAGLPPEPCRCGHRAAAKSSSYKDWSLALQDYAAGHADEMNHWQALADVPAALPCAHPRASNTVADQQTIELQLDRATTEAFLKDAPAAYRTQANDLLLTALGRALCAWGGHSTDPDRSRRPWPRGPVRAHRPVPHRRLVHRAVPGGAVAAGRDRRGDQAREGRPARDPQQGPGPRRVQALGRCRAARGAGRRCRGRRWSSTTWASSTLVSAKAAQWVPGRRSRRHADRRRRAAHARVLGQRPGVRRQAAAERDLQPPLRHDEAAVQGLGTALPGRTRSAGAPLRGRRPRRDALGLSAGRARPAGDSMRCRCAAAHLADLYPLSPMQSGMLFQTLLEQGGGAYQSTSCGSISKDLDRGALLRGLARPCCKRHDVLRTAFLRREGRPLQCGRPRRAIAVARGGLARTRRIARGADCAGRGRAVARL